MNHRLAPLMSKAPAARIGLGVLGLGLLLTACDKPRPRSFTDFMDDQIAREGVLARCNQNPLDTAADVECANARRAAATIALRAERERREAFERESERKLEALRTEMAERERIVRDATLAAARAEREAYEKLWRDDTRRAGAGADAGADEGDVEAAEPPPDRLNLIVLPPQLRQDPADSAPAGSVPPTQPPPTRPPPGRSPPRQSPPTRPP